MTNGSGDGLIARWLVLAFVSGLFALFGTAVSAYGLWLTSMSYLAYRRATQRAQQNLPPLIPGVERLRYVVSWDVLLFAVAFLLALVQLGVAINLVRLGDVYTEDLVVVLVRLDGQMFPAYVGYTMAVVISTLIAPSYVIARWLTAPRPGEHTGDRVTEHEGAPLPEAQP